MSDDQGAEHFYATGDDIVMVTSFGVGWASPTLTELVADESMRPAVAMGAVGGITRDGQWLPVHVPMTTPWIGLAQLAGQIDALKGKLPDEFMDRWRQEFERARAYADANLDKVRLYEGDE